MLQHITPVILTYNEAPNIARCLDGLSWAQDIVIVDSFSDDQTLSIISNYPQARCIQRQFDDHASQWMFALKETGITTEWVLALDADYRLPEEFVAELEGLTPDSTVMGYQARFNYCMYGRALRSGVYPPVTLLYRRNRATYEQDGHTQRLIIAGLVERLTTRLAHDDRKPLSRWLESQRKYALLEANKIVAADAETLNLADRIRRLRVIAPLAVLIYCLIWKGGLLDGWAGMYYALQRAFSELLLSLHLLERDLAAPRMVNDHQKVDSRPYAESLKSDHVDVA